MRDSDEIRNVLQNRFCYDKIMAMENDKKITIFFTCPIYQQIQGICKEKSIFSERSHLKWQKK